MKPTKAQLDVLRWLAKAGDEMWWSEFNRGSVGKRTVRVLLDQGWIESRQRGWKVAITESGRALLS